MRRLRLWKVITIVLSIMVFGWVGCIPKPDLKVNLALTKSQEIFDNTKALVLICDKKIFTEKLINIEKKLDKLTLYWADMPEKEAINEARLVQKQSKELEKEARPYAIQKMENLVQKIENDPDSPLTSYLPEIKKLIVKVRRNVLISSNDLPTITDPEKIILKSDISFGLGKYKLSQIGKDILNQFFKYKIKKEINQYKGRVEHDNTLVLNIKIIGYTDKTGFSNRTMRKIKRESLLCNDLPSQPIKRRKKLNKCLSMLRVQAIDRYLRKLIKEEFSTIRIVKNCEGKGEDIPPNVTPISNTNDPNRRICKIYCHITYGKGLNTQHK